MSVFDSIKHKIEKSLKSLGGKIESGLKSTGNKIEGELKHTGVKITHDIKDLENQVTRDLNELANDLETGLNAGVSELIELVEKGVLGEALEKIIDAIEKEIGHGNAPIKWKTAYFELEVLDAKAFARIIRDAINNGLPTSKAEWRKIIVEIAPVAITPIIGIPLISTIVKRIPLEDLEREALNELLKKCGL